MSLIQCLKKTGNPGVFVGSSDNRDWCTVIHYIHSRIVCHTARLVVTWSINWIISGKYKHWTQLILYMRYRCKAAVITDGSSAMHFNEFHRKCMKPRREVAVCYQCTTSAMHCDTRKRNWSCVTNCSHVTASVAFCTTIYGAFSLNMRRHRTCSAHLISSQNFRGAKWNILLLHRASSEVGLPKLGFSTNLKQS